MNKKSFNRLIIILSIVIPLAVVLLFNIKLEGYDFSFLPPIYATVNGVTGFMLIIAFLLVKNGKIKLHENIMKLNLILSASFLVMYILYHITSEPTSYLGEGLMKYIYYFVLLTHILLSVAVVPLVLLTFSKGILNDINSHKKLAKIAFPMWVYVAFTGVIVYLMISPYYN